MLTKITKSILFILEAMSIIVFCTVTLSVFIGVIDRFVLHIGFFWTEELARFTFIWMGFLASAIIVQLKGHFNCSYFLDMFNKRAKTIIEWVISIMVLGLMVVLIVYGLKLTEFAESQMSPALGIPMSYIYFSVPFSAAIMGFFIVVDMYHTIMKRKESKEQG